MDNESGSSALNHSSESSGVVNSKGKLQSMQLNTNKAGMEGLDTSKINDIIQRASVGSKFYQHKQRVQERIDQKVSQLKALVEGFTHDQILKAENEMSKLAEEMESERDLTRTLVHIDMDMFYAAVEMRDNSSLKDKPMAVGSNSMLSTSNYVARKFGVRAAMPGFIGKKLCPDLIIVAPNFKRYRAISEEIQDIFKDYDPEFSQMSLDEAYLDITEYLILHQHLYKQDTEKEKSAGELVVGEIRRKIEEKTQLTASAGIAVNTRLAKICSDMNKPNGQYFLPPNREAIDSFIRNLPIRKIPGIGSVTEQQLKGLGIITCSDLWKMRGLLRLLFSETSYAYFLRISLGLGSTDLTPASESDCKSVSNETTFLGTSDRTRLLGLCLELCEALTADMEKKKIFGKVFTLKMKTEHFEVRTRSQTLLEYTRDEEVMMSVAKTLLISEMEGETKNAPLTLRLLGVKMSKLVHQDQFDPRKQVRITQLFKKDHPVGNETKPTTADVQPSASRTPDEESVEAKDLVCPVCCERSFVHLGDLNAHVDLCLNFGLVSKLAKEEGLTGARGGERDQISPPVAKRRKGASQKTSSDILRRFLGLQ